MSIKKKAVLSNTELSAFCAQLAMILHSGISAYEGISIIDSETDSKETHKLLTEISETLYESASLYTALEKTGVFPGYMLNMTRIGEETGTLDSVMQSLAEHYEREENLSSAIKNTIRYPAVMAAMMLAVIIILLVRVLPIFNRVYIQLGTEMTGLSRVLMNIGSAIGRWSAVLCGIAVIILLLAVVAAYTEKGKAVLKRTVLKLGMFGKIRSLRSSMRFADGIALSLSAGLNPDTALELISGLEDGEDYKQKIKKCRESFLESGDFSAALQECEIFSGVYAHMASVGIKTGNAAEVMRSIAALYSDELDAKMNNLLAAIEPILVITLSLTVGLILMSVMLPLMGIISGI